MKDLLWHTLQSYCSSLDLLREVVQIEGWGMLDNEITVLEAIATYVGNLQYDLHQSNGGFLGTQAAKNGYTYEDRRLD